MYLGIEIGGTKLQLGVGEGDGPELIRLERQEIDAGRGAAGILSQIREAAKPLVIEHNIQRVGIGFGGPVDADAGRTITSHQVDGWNDVPLVDWCRDHLGIPGVLGNDCDVAALAEARYGAGKGRRCVFYVTVGTGIGGGLVINGQLHGAGRPAAAEIGHLRPGLNARESTDTVEALASGPGLSHHAVERLQRELSRNSADKGSADEIEKTVGGDWSRLDPRLLAQLAESGNPLAANCLEEATRALGWAIAQVVTITAADVVIVGGGVSLIGERFFFSPLRKAASQFIFPPLSDSFEIVAAALGEEVVVHGAIALAAGA